MNEHRRAERLILRIPMFAAAGLALLYMAGRFTAILSEDLKERPDSLAAVILLALIIGTASLLIVAFCAAVGVTVGLTLRALARSMWRWQDRTALHRG